MQRLKLTIAYVGTRFYGWQRQTLKDAPELRTVQYELEKIASHIAGQKVNIPASGRTDTGVHADAQVAHMDVPAHRADLNWVRAFNAQLPHDVAVASVEAVPSTFHAQYSALSKRYAYSLWLRKDYTPPRIQKFVWSIGALNLPAMQEAALHMLGTRDFISFCNVGAEYATSVRTVESIELLPSSPENPFLAVWHFQANGFLKQMVRNMMGLLVAVGKGKIDPEAVPQIIAAQNRRLSAATAPAQGLCLNQVFY